MSLLGGLRNVLIIVFFVLGIVALLQYGPVRNFVAPVAEIVEPVAHSAVPYVWHAAHALEKRGAVKKGYANRLVGKAASKEVSSVLHAKASYALHAAADFFLLILSGAGNLVVYLAVKVFESTVLPVLVVGVVALLLYNRLPGVAGLLAPLLGVFSRTG